MKRYFILLSVFVIMCFTACGSRLSILNEITKSEKKASEEMFMKVINKLEEDEKFDYFIYFSYYPYEENYTDGGFHTIQIIKDFKEDYDLIINETPGMYYP